MKKLCTVNRYLVKYMMRVSAPLIVPTDEAGNETRVGWDNLNETVFLVVMNE